MLLTGTYPRTVDEKSRLVLPKRVRELMNEPAILFVTPGPDKSLWLYTEAELERLAARLDQSPATDAEARVFRRLYFAQTETVDLDKTGRLLIPERLAQFAGLQKEVVLIGVRDHLELWDATRWTSFVNDHAAQFDQIAEKAFEK
ncbi:MAG: division/cell wall cluster transcriptional repressor MraZ [Planctomycetes bacterium]|nr:division/cell wall cluster transcriptional repressor MraZ [Planctomycetota bacterium]